MNVNAFLRTTKSTTKRSQQQETTQTNARKCNNQPKTFKQAFVTPSYCLLYPLLHEKEEIACSCNGTIKDTSLGPFCDDKHTMRQQQKRR